MDISFKNTKCEPDPELMRDTTKRIAALERFLGKGATTARASMELERAIGGQNKGDIWRAELTVVSEGAQYRAESTKTKLENAITTVLRDIAEDLRKAGRRDQHLFRKGGATVKGFLRGFGMR